MISRELSITATEAWLVVVSAVGIYGTMIALSRLSGPRQFLSSSSYDLAFTFAMGSLIGRVVLVRTSLAVAVVGLCTMFALHAVTTFLHHRFELVHRLIENRPVLVVAHGRMVEEGLRRTRASESEIRQQLRSQGHGSLERVRAAIMERDGSLSVISGDEPLDPEFLSEVLGREHLAPGQ